MNFELSPYEMDDLMLKLLSASDLKDVELTPREKIWGYSKMLIEAGGLERLMEKLIYGGSGFVQAGEEGNPDNPNDIKHISPR